MLPLVINWFKFCNEVVSFAFVSNKSSFRIIWNGIFKDVVISAGFDKPLLASTSVGRGKIGIV